MNLMKFLPSLLILAYVSPGHSLCNPDFTGVSQSVTESSADGSVQRTITKYGDVYTYDVSLRAYPVSQGSFSVKIELNGKITEVTGLSYCTGASAQVLSNVCDAPASLPGQNVRSDLFFYAANGDHVNAWDGSFQTQDPATGKWSQIERFHFPQEKFADMDFR